MTKEESAIVSAYTGYLCGAFEDLQAYADKLLGYPTFTHQYGDKVFAANLKELSKSDFISLQIGD